MKRREIEQRTILLSLTGSQAYGLANANSDYDYKGVFIASAPYYLGFKTIEQKDKGWQDKNDPASGLFPVLEGVNDVCLYELRKFLDLSLDNNPNILEMLYMPEHCYVYKSPLFDEVIRNRDLILSKKVKFSLSGYAFSQLKRIESHRKWLLDPPSEAPRLSDFGLDETSLLTKEQLHAFINYLFVLIKDRIEWMHVTEELREIFNQIDYKGVLVHHQIPDTALEYTSYLTRGTQDFMNVLHQTQLYRKAKKEWDAYQEWTHKRNPARAALEEKCGFDAKHGSHALRLLAMGLEALEHQTLFVDRTDIDAEWLLAVKNGDVSYEEVMGVCNSRFDELECSYKSSKLRHSPDRESVNDLCVHLVKEYL